MTSNLAVIERDWDYPIRERRSSLENPQTPLSMPAEWLLDIFQGGRTDSGIRVSELTAFQIATFVACVDLIAGKIASLPFHLYQRSLSDSGRAIHRIAYEHDYYELVHTEPNEEMTRQTLLKAFLVHCLAWGNGYAELQRDAGNYVVAIWPRNPAKTRPLRLTKPIHLEAEPWRPFPLDLPAGTLVYETTDGMDDQDTSELGVNSSSYKRLIPTDDMLHVPGLSFDGRLGQSIVQLARQTLGLALATEKFGAKYFANFARPGGILKMPMNLKPEDRESSKRSWQEAQGGENSNRVAVMPPGFEWQAMSNNPQEAQTIETRAYIRNEIASMLHVPVRMVGDTAKASKASTEQENQELLDYTLSPWISAIKLEFKRKLFPHPGLGRRPKSPFYVDFDTSEMIRGDAASREKFYASGSQWSYLCPNDIRGFEKLNPIQEPWAEEFRMPVNMTLVTTPINPTHQDGAGNGIVPGAEKRTCEPLAYAYSRLFVDAFSRVPKRGKQDTQSFANLFSPVLYAIRDSLLQDARRELRCAADPSEESGHFINEYIRTMQKRYYGDPPTEDSTVEQELYRAIRAIRVAVFRDIAGQRAKEQAPVS
jgi:HK97 family phage portal protein